MPPNPTLSSTLESFSNLTKPAAPPKSYLPSWETDEAFHAMLRRKNSHVDIDMYKVTPFLTTDQSAALEARALRRRGQVFTPSFVNELTATLPPPSYEEAIVAGPSYWEELDKETKNQPHTTSVPTSLPPPPRRLSGLAPQTQRELKGDSKDKMPAQALAPAQEEILVAKCHRKVHEGKLKVRDLFAATEYTWEDDCAMVDELRKIGIL